MASPQTTLIRQWFFRSAGKWTSNRRYFYPTKGANKQITSDLTVKVEDNGKPNSFSVELTWDSKEGEEVASEGEMLCEFNPETSVLHRNIGYMTEDETASQVSLIDFNTILLNTEYDGFAFREEIRLLDDNTRLRQTVGKRGDNIVLVGQYFERRVT